MHRLPDRHRLVTFLTSALLPVVLLLVLHPARAPFLDLLRQGDEYAAAVERTAAVSSYEAAARLRPGDPDPYLRLARLYLDWGRTEDALAALREAERLGTQGIGPERMWVAVHAVRGDWLAVVKHARRWLALSPGDGPARHALADAYVQLRQWTNARAEYEALVTADLADALAQERLGALLVGDDPAAIQHLFAAGTSLADRLLDALGEPGAADDTSYAAARLGQVLIEEQEWALAVRLFERALAGSPDYPDAHAYLGYALDHVGDVTGAHLHLSRAVALDPNSPVAHTFLGLHYERVGDVAAARAEYETAYDLDATNPAVCVEIGQTWAAEGRYVAAEIWLREAVSLQPDDPVLWEVLARFYLDHHITAGGRGVEAAEALVELLPDDARAIDLQGWAAFQAGDYDAARDRLTQAVLLDPTLASAHYHLGQLWALRGERQRAETALIRAVDLDTTGTLVPLAERALSEIR